MSIIRRMRKQKCVYWARNDKADEFGQFSYALPVEISCRWDDEQREIIAANGTKTMTKAICYPDRDVRVGDMLMNALLEDLLEDSNSNGTNDTNEYPLPSIQGAYEVIGTAKIPNLKAREFLRIAYM